MLIRVRLFAMLRERAGRADVAWQVDPGETVGGLWAALCSEFPGLGGTDMPVAFAVNQEYVDRLHRLQDDDEVAIIPPVSGGSPMYSLSPDPIDLGDLVAVVSDPAAGAIATFLGLTRNHNDGRTVTLLEYEAYPGMAEQEMERIGLEAARRWAIEKIAVVHRTGPVPVGEASVAIAVSAAHRREAFAACQFVIDQLKKTVPVWKKEHFEGGDIWIEHRSSCRKGEA